MKDLVIYGSGGFGAAELTWLIEEINMDSRKWNILGFLDDDPSNVGKNRYGYEVLGGADWIKKHKNLECVIGVSNGLNRCQIYERIKNDIAGFPSLIHPNVTYSRHAMFGEGNLLFPGVLISGKVDFQDHVIIHMGCTIGHDTVIGAFSTILPGANISGYVEIGSYCSIGAGAVIRQEQKIGNHAVIGAGAAVVSDIPACSTAVGIPAKVIKTSER